MSRRVIELTGAAAEAEVRRHFKRKRAREEGLRLGFSGWVDAVCRNADGGVAWEVHQKNLVTDFGRARWVGEDSSVFHSFSIAISPSTETPLVGRSCLFDNAVQGAVSIADTPSVSAVTLIKTWAITFAAPASNRTIGTIGLVTRADSYDANRGMQNLLAYTLLATPKTQSTSQTLEVQYKITLTPTF